MSIYPILKPRSFEMFSCPLPSNFGQKCPLKSAYYAAKLNSRQKCVNQIKLLLHISHFEGAHLIQNHCLKGAHLTLFESIPKMFLRGSIEYFTPKIRNCDICLICNKSAYATSQMCPLKQLCAPNHGCRGCKIKGPGLKPKIKAWALLWSSGGNSRTH